MDFGMRAHTGRKAEGGSDQGVYGGVHTIIWVREKEPVEITGSLTSKALFNIDK